jgi:hypothetical protein
VLINAGVRIGGGPHRCLGPATAHVVERNYWAMSGMLRNLPAGDANVVGVTDRAGRPAGYRHPCTWVMPQKAGTLGTYGNIFGTGSLAAAAAAGINIVATIDGTSTFEGTGQLVVSAVALIEGSSSVVASIVAVLNAEAALAGTGSVAADIVALGYAIATLNGSGTLTLTSYATGTLNAEISPFTELSPESLATNVWAALQSANGDTGSMGEALTLVQAILKNRTVTDPVAGTFTVYDTDDVTVLLTGDLWADAAGTTPYDGTGAERRDRLG